ncbi:S8 family serine peptidase [Streptomyces sp. NBC_00887]|uniref:S8 family serine peptidase n=1 Tax=Streptomyces sp. NBC_00887 TaxID=2975859 RepID=UPI003867311B|nr:S8 family serine peptidase [Streptomyces sp. NBC_00887]WSY36224.1 S8 family serine peptidase [Streptomyces sp. NBC_00887]
MAQATPAAHQPTAAPPAPSQAARTVTLITGDKVTLTPRPKGGPTLSVQRPADATGSLRTVTDATGTYVYPGDADTYVAEGLLDKRLFNVTGLIAQGYDDTHTTGLPLIITRDAAAARMTGAHLPGVVVKGQLASARAVAATADRARAGLLWKSLLPATQRTPAPKSSTGRSLPGVIDRIWLDGKVRATLAESTAQIGAPQVWEQGAIGTGVKVAVLDTGVDAAHQDLHDRIVSTRSFVPGEDVTDRRGHGTHVASIIAGTGAASAGKERGVAPGADLAIGKVLSDSGSGTESGIIAGMEWAARTEHAKIISMSLGNSSTHTQADPMSQSVNALSQETGALFVIAAGNSGPGEYTVNAPGTAETALTVGAVDVTDQMAGFSSSGPREGDQGLKPDLTAPGVNILAARSQHLPGEGAYTSKSGTSMATPHVAGTAALLLEKHPDWTGQQLKNALMSTSKVTSGISAYRGGSGRADISAAFRTQVVASGAVDTGLIKWARDPKPIERRITYTNSGSTPIELRLSLERGTSPPSLFAMGTDQVTVPAHGSTSVPLVIDPREVAAGAHTGQVIAHDHAGTALVHTMLSARTETERHDLVLQAKDRQGRPTTGTAQLVSAQDPLRPQFLQIPESGLTLHLPRGSYAATMFKDVQGAHGAHSKGLALLGDPEIELTEQRTVIFDASRAHQIRALTPKPNMPAHTRLEYWRSFTTTHPQYGTPGDVLDNRTVGPEYDSVWAQPSTGKVKHGGFILTTRWRAPQTPLTVSYDGHDIDVLTQNGSKPLPEGTTTMADAVFAGTGTPADYARLSAAGKAAVVRRSTTVTPYEQSQAAHAAGVKMLLVVNDAVGRLNTWYGLDDYESAGPVAVASVTGDDGEALIADIAESHGAKVRLRATAHPDPSYLYDLVSQHTAGIPEDLDYRAAPQNLARIDLTFGQDAKTRATETRMDFPPYVFGGGSSFPSSPVARGPRTDWVSTGNDIRWQQKVSAREVLDQSTDVVSYRPAHTYQDRWLTPIMRPRMISEHLPVRQYGAKLVFTTPAWGDNGTAHAGQGYNSGGLSQRTLLYRGEELLAESDYDSGYAWDLPPEAARYRLVVEGVNANPAFSPYSTSTRTEWSFVSGEAEQQILPLVQLDYEVNLDAEGRARRNAALEVTPSVLGDPGTNVSSLGLEVSYDDGATWHRPRTTHHKGTWKTSLAAPKAASFVTLRATARDEKGGSITQTLTRAYGLK